MKKPRTRVRLVLGAVLAGCSFLGGIYVLPRRLAAPQRIGEFAAVEEEARLRSVERWVPHGQLVEAAALRAGGGLVALLQHVPASRHLVELAGFPHPPVMGGPLSLASRATPTNSAMGKPVDVLGIARDGSTLFLDASNRQIIGETISLTRTVRARMRAAAQPIAGCLVNDSAFAIVDAAKRGVIPIQRFRDSVPYRLLALPSPLRGSPALRWSALRFGGSPDGPCVLWSPQLPSVLLVTDSSVTSLGNFVEPVVPEPWYRVLQRILRREPAPKYALDATTFPGIVAVLFGGHTSGAGRMIDLYTDAGAYLQTLVVPPHVVRIAGYHERLYAYRQDGDSLVLTGYVLPWKIRAPIRERLSLQRGHTPTPPVTSSAPSPRHGQGAHAIGRSRWDHATSRPAG